MGSGVARIAGELGEVAAEAGAACCADLDRVCGLMGLSRVRCARRCVLHRGLVRCLPLFSCVSDVEVVLIRPSSIRVLGRVQDLLLALELLLKHDLRLLLVGTCAAVLQGLGVAAGAPLAVTLVNGSRTAPIIL